MIRKIADAETAANEEEEEDKDGDKKGEQSETRPADMHESGGLIRCSIPQQCLYSTLTVRAGALSTVTSRQQPPCGPLPPLAANMNTGACTPSVVSFKPQAF